MSGRVWIRVVQVGSCVRFDSSSLTANPVHHDHSKHIIVGYPFVRKRVAYGDLVVRHVHTQLQLADIFKGLSS